MDQTLFSGKITGLRTEDLDLDETLLSGQVFRWSQDREGIWRGRVGQRLVRLRQSGEGGALYWEAEGQSEEEAGEAVRSFLRLEDLDLPAQAEEWSRLDPLFARAWALYPGIRILRQDPDECFFSFLCASVAPVARISQMVQAVASAGSAKTERSEDHPSPFPDAVALCQVSEERLRALGLGFRASRVVSAARRLALLPASPLPGLRECPLTEAKQMLTSFAGVGEKIADCIALFALDKDEAIPVDTHIWRLARTHYLPELAGKSLTASRYSRVVVEFQERFGPAAGWAQQILFRSALGKEQ